MDAQKSKNFIWIVLAGIVASVLIGMLAKILEWSFLEDFSIIGPSAWAGYAIGCYCYGEKRYTTFKEWAGYAIGCYCYGEKRYTTFKEWAAFLAAALLVTTVFWAVTEYVF